MGEEGGKAHGGLQVNYSLQNILVTGLDKADRDVVTLDGVRSNFGDLAACIHFEVVRDKDGRLKTCCTLLSRCEGIAIALLFA